MVQFFYKLISINFIKCNSDEKYPYQTIIKNIVEKRANLYFSKSDKIIGGKSRINSKGIISILDLTTYNKKSASKSLRIIDNFGD
jgi:hypothetical protein